MASGSSSVKLLVDECIGKNATKALASLFQFHKPPIVVEHMIDFTGRQGVKDDEWIKKARDDQWFVITGDRGKKHVGPPLQLLLPLNGIRAAFTTGTIQSKRNGFERARAVLCLWPQIERSATASAPGTRFRIRITATGFSFVEWPLTDKQRRRMEEVQRDLPFARNLFEEPNG